MQEISQSSYSLTHHYFGSERKLFPVFSSLFAEIFVILHLITGYGPKGPPAARQETSAEAAGETFEGKTITALAVIRRAWNVRVSISQRR